MQRSIVKILKNKNVSPYYIEKVYYMDNTDLQGNKLMTNKEYEKLFLYSEKELKKEIFRVYYNKQAPVLPDHIKELIHQAKSETDYEGWALTLDWFAVVNDFDWDSEMSDYCCKEEDAREVYGYILSLELEV